MVIKNIEMISIHDFKVQKLKHYYGSTKKVYRKSHVDRLLRMWDDLHYLTELSTRTALVPHNEEFLKTKAIPSYNDTLERLQKKYPNIKEFQNFKKIRKKKLLVLDPLLLNIRFK